MLLDQRADIDIARSAVLIHGVTARSSGATLASLGINAAGYAQACALKAEAGQVLLAPGKGGFDLVSSRYPAALTAL